MSTTTSRPRRKRLSFTLPLLVLSSFIFPSFAVKFELPAFAHPTTRCIWNTAHENALIIVTANVGPGKGQRVDVEVRAREGSGNVYLSKKDIKGETRLAVTAHADEDIGVCFKNTLESDQRQTGTQFVRIVDLDVDIGADAVDYNAIANQDGLSALEVEMRKLEGVVKEIVDELGYLKEREGKFTNTNESTNNRVQNFGVFTLFALIALGVWQIFHLRAFFRRKYLID